MEQKITDPKLIFIYGPPASGKLTVALELEKQINFELYHNHMTIIKAKELFTYGSKEFYSYCDKERLDFFEKSKQSGKNIIFTFCYALNISDDFIKKVLAIYDSILFVQLIPSRETIISRVVDESREKYRKLNSIESLASYIEEKEVFTPIPFVESFKLDNSNLSPKKVVKKIIAHYTLKE